MIRILKYNLDFLIFIIHFISKFIYNVSSICTWKQGFQSISIIRSWVWDKLRLKKNATKATLTFGFIQNHFFHISSLSAKKPSHGKLRRIYGVHGILILLWFFRFFWILPIHFFEDGSIQVLIIYSLTLLRCKYPYVSSIKILENKICYVSS